MTELALHLLLHVPHVAVGQLLHAQSYARPHSLTSPFKIVPEVD